MGSTLGAETLVLMEKSVRTENDPNFPRFAPITLPDTIIISYMQTNLLTAIIVLS